MLPFFYRKKKSPKTKRISSSNKGDLQISSIPGTCWRMHVSESRWETGNFLPLLIASFSVSFRSAGP